METIAFLGTGLMGAPMVERLLKAGYQVRAWNRSAAKAEALRSAGALPCPGVGDAVDGATTICLCLTNGDAIENLLYGPEKLAARIAPGALVIDFSTIGIEAARGFAGRLSGERGIDWVDAPVSGGVAGVRAGTLAIFVGGEDGPVERAMPVLSAIGGQITHMGKAGAGQATKLCNQVIVSANMTAIAEATRLGEIWGIDVARLAGALSGGWADSLPLRIFGPRMASETDPGPRVSELKTMFKDIRAIREAAHGAPTPLIDAVGALYAAPIEAGFGSEDFPALMRNYRQGPVPGETKQ